jgi:hypothetical protein
MGDLVLYQRRWGLIFVLEMEVLQNGMPENFK